MMRKSMILPWMRCLPAVCSFFCAALLPASASENNLSAKGAGAHFLSYPKTNQIQTLTHGEAVEKELDGGQTHNYQIQLKAGQYIYLVCEQRGIDVILTFWGSAGAKLFEVDSPNGAQGPESMTYVTETAGTYRIEIRSELKDARPGRYQLKVVELRDATAQDRISVAAHKAVTEGQELRSQRNAAAFRKAIEKFDEALRLWREVGDRAEEANALNSMGAIYQLLNEPQKALAAYQQSFEIRRELGDVPGQAQSLNNLANLSDSLDDKQKAIEQYELALELWRKADDRPGVAVTLSNLGWTYAAVGESAKALEYMNQSLQLRRELNDREGEAATLNNLGAFYYGQGELAKAAEYLEQTLPLIRSVPDPRGEAYTLTNLGLTYDALGEKQKALENHLLALAKLREIGDRDGESSTLNNLGLYYLMLGDLEQASYYYNEALPIFRALNSRSGEASLMNALGVVAVRRADHRQGLEYLNRALLLRREISDRDGEAHVEYNIGAAYEGAGDRARAVESYQRALEIWRAIGSRSGESRALGALGAAFRESGEREKSADYQQQALTIRRNLSDRSGEAMARRELALLAQERGELTEARAQIEAALEIIESIRTKLAGQDLRSAYFASVRDYYDTYLALLMRLHGQDRRAGYDARALQVSEKARARSLMETLAEARDNVREGIAPALLERERGLERQINVKTDQRIRLLTRPHKPEQLAAINRELEGLSAEARQVQAQIRSTSPRYAALTQPQTLTPAEIRQQILDPETVLLEYALGEKQSYLWVVTSQKFAVFELPARAQIEASAREVYRSLIARAETPAGEDATQRRTRIAAADAQVRIGSARLSETILGPASKLLKETAAKRWLIVADGALQFVPFGALPDCGLRVGACETNHHGSRQSPPPLIAGREVINLPSASMLAVLRREHADRRPPPKSVAILADPVFEMTDQRVQHNLAEQAAVKPGPATQARTGQPPGNNRSIAWEDIFAGQPIHRLQFSQREAAVITDLTPEKDRRVLLGFDATHGNAKDPQLGEYRIVHFSTHGLLNSRHPELSGILLSMIDQRGQPQADSFLRLGEIYNLKLPVDLVVLSACQTAIGKDVKGEGLIGLTRGFMYAGASRVVASLWRVDDEATAELMRRFYAGMLGKQSLRSAEALRRAQIALWRSREWNAPFYWAGFTMQGEWK